LLLAPLVSIWLAAAAIIFNFLPPAVYPIPNGTPALLGAFMGTDGSWRVLVFTLLLLLISMLIYYPFVKATLSRQTLKEAATFA
jgi:PTS system cellobiose-specific IIC component